MDASDGETVEQQVELLKKDLKFAIEYCYFSTPLNQTNQHRNAEVETLLNMRKSSIVWNIADKEILNAADLEDWIQTSKNI